MPATERRMPSDFELLARLGSFTGLSPEQQRRIFAAMTVYEIAQGGAIFTDGQQLSDVFVLLSGAAHLSSIGFNRKRIKIALFPPGVIAQLPALAHLSQFRCEAMRQCRVGRISRDEFIHLLLGTRAREFDHAAKLLLSRTEAFMTRYFVGLDVRARVAALLLELELLSVRAIHAEQCSQSRQANAIWPISPEPHARELAWYCASLPATGRSIAKPDSSFWSRLGSKRSRISLIALLARP